MKLAALLLLVACGEPEEPAPIVTLVEQPPADLCIRRRECCWPVPVPPGLICVECCD